MCADGRLKARELANLTHAVAKMSAAGKLAAADADVQDMLAALEERVVHVASDMKPQEVSNTVYSFAVLGREPGAAARGALEVAVMRVGPDMVPQAVANTAWSFATLGLMPGAEARAALEVAVVRTSPSMKPQELANTLWSVLALTATRDLPLPACYPSLWWAACGLDVGSFKDEGRRMMYHAHMIHTELVSGDVLEEVTFPPWIMHEAREAWMRNIRHDVTVSNSHKAVASIIGELGIRCELECLSDCGCFSVDIVVPDDDIALEFDGPTHFINTSNGGKGGAPGQASRTSTKTPKTELRDKFLWRRYRTVLFVPFFEWDALQGSAARKVYVAAKLRAAGVSVPA